jgi:hypothetical protein
MKKNMKITSLILALALALTAVVTSLAESTAETPSAASAAEAAQAAADAAQSEANALNEALEAYGKAKSESRRLSILTGLKEELDGYVAAGSLTQDQADLILNYYAEQLTLQQNGAGFGRGSRMKNDGTNGANGLGGKGGRGGRGGHGGSGRFGLQQNGTEQGSVPEAPVSPDASGT